MFGLAVSITVHCYCTNTQLLGSSDDTTSYLSSVGNQDLIKQLHITTNSTDSIGKPITNLMVSIVGQPDKVRKSINTYSCIINTSMVCRLFSCIGILIHAPHC